MKSPSIGKSRLRRDMTRTGATSSHDDLVLAIAADTVAAARAVPYVRRMLVVTTDRAALRELAELDVELTAQNGPAELNSALRHGERLLRGDDPGSVVGALQADLPALRPTALAAAVSAAGGARAFTADRHGSGTTLLLSAPGGQLLPQFGPGSARAHADSGATRLELDEPSLRTDVDTVDDLDHAREVGLGPRTRACLLELISD